MEAKPKKSVRSKIETLSLLLKLGHEACEKKDRVAALAHVTDASISLVAYDNSSVLEVVDGAAKVLAATAFPPSTLNRDTEYCRNVEALSRPFAEGLDKPLVVDEALLEERGVPSSAKAAFEWFRGAGFATVLFIPMPSPPVAAGREGVLLWSIESRRRLSEGEISTLALLARHYSEALWLSRAPKLGHPTLRFLAKRSSWFWMAAAASALVALFAVHPRLSANARFELDSLRRSVARAPFQGVVERIERRNGDKISKGDIVLHLDSAEAALELAKAEKSFEAAKTGLDVARKESFEKTSELGRLKLLEIDAEEAAIDADIARWKLERHDIKARQSGMVVFDDERKLLGARVTRGEKLFAVVDPGRPVARILIDEKDAETLSDGVPEVTLYFHADPAVGVSAKVVSVSPKPALMENGRFCYVLRAVPSASSPTRYGAAGTAKVSGPRRSLVYHFLRNFVIWWRGL